MLGLRPWEFERFTLAEYGQMVEGVEKREDRERYRMAELASWLLAPYATSPISPKKLLGKQ